MSEWRVLQMDCLPQSEWRVEVCHIDCRLRSPFGRYDNVQHITSQPLSFLQDGLFATVGMTSVADGLFATVGTTGWSMSYRPFLRSIFWRYENVQHIIDILSCIYNKIIYYKYWLLIFGFLFDIIIE